MQTRTQRATGAGINVGKREAGDGRCAGAGLTLNALLSLRVWVALSNTNRLGVRGAPKLNAYVALRSGLANQDQSERQKNEEDGWKAWEKSAGRRTVAAAARTDLVRTHNRFKRRPRKQ
jgi:hypothetical protein